jgi:hypothetical protein
MSFVGEEDNIDKMVDLLNTFLCISMLQLNWENSLTWDFKLQDDLAKEI